MYKTIYMAPRYEESKKEGKRGKGGKGERGRGLPVKDNVWNMGII